MGNKRPEIHYHLVDGRMRECRFKSRCYLPTFVTAEKHEQASSSKDVKIRKKGAGPKQGRTQNEEVPQKGKAQKKVVLKPKAASKGSEPLLISKVRVMVRKEVNKALDEWWDRLKKDEPFFSDKQKSRSKSRSRSRSRSRSKSQSQSRSVSPNYTPTPGSDADESAQE